MRLGCLGTIIGIALLWGGGQGLYTAATNLKPTVCSVQDYIRDKPRAKWLRLTGGIVDLVDMSYSGKKNGGGITELYAPVKLGGAPEGEPVHVLLSTKDPALLSLAEEMRQLKGGDDSLRFMQKHAGELMAQRDVEGLVRFGIDGKSKDEEKLKALNKNLAPDFVVLTDGERPNLARSAVFFLIGLALIGWLLLRGVGRSSAPAGVA